MSFRLRDYQSADVRRIMTRLGPSRRIMYFLPTGGGKTTCATEVARRWLARLRANRIAWLTHRAELESQSADTLARAGISARKTKVISPVRLINRIKSGEITPLPSDLLIIDEAHHSPARVWNECVNLWPGPVLGLSATPWRLSKKEGFDHIFEHMVYGPTKSELIRRRYLVPSLVKRPPDTDVIVGKGSDGSGDYSVSRTASGQNPGVLIERAIDWLAFWERVYQRKLKTLIYCLNINHALAVAKYATSTGIPTETLSAKTPKEERRAVIERYRIGKTSAIANVGILTEGFDAPATDCVLCLRPTQSLSLWVQMAGRANRLSDRKEFGLILDGTTNTERLGHPDTDFPWNLRPRTDSRVPGEGDSPLRRCPDPECQTLNPTGVKACVECGRPFGLECPICGWVFAARGSDGQMIMPDLDPLGRCERCSVTAQERRFGRTIPGPEEFASMFKCNANDNLTYSDPNTNMHFWIKPGYDDHRGSANSRGGAYLADPAITEMLPANVSTRKSERSRNLTLTFNGETTHRRRTPDAVIRYLYENVYHPAMLNMTSAGPVRNMPGKHGDQL